MAMSRKMKIGLGLLAFIIVAPLLFGGKEKQTVRDVGPKISVKYISNAEQRKASMDSVGASQTRAEVVGNLVGAFMNTPGVEIRSEDRELTNAVATAKFYYSGIFSKFYVEKSEQVSVLAVNLPLLVSDVAKQAPDFVAVTISAANMPQPITKVYEVKNDAGYERDPSNFNVASYKKE